MKRLYIFIFTLLVFSSLLAQNGHYDDRPYTTGEFLDFRVKYGWFTIGRATVEIPKDTIVQNRNAYLVKVIASTAGLLGIFNNTEDTFTGTVYKDDFKPYYASQNFQEGRDRDIQENVYDFDHRIVTVNKTDHRKNKTFPPKVYELEPDAYGMVSSYLYLRNLDFNQMKMEDSVMMRVFFGKKHYQFGLEYGGIEEIKTNYGKIQAHKLYILFPVTKTFPEARSVMVWTTTDANQLPVKIRAELKFGQVTCELEEYRNLRHPFRHPE